MDIFNYEIWMNMYIPALVMCFIIITWAILWISGLISGFIFAISWILAFLQFASLSVDDVREYYNFVNDKNPHYDYLFIGSNLDRKARGSIFNVLTHDNLKKSGHLGFYMFSHLNIARIFIDC